MSYLPIKLRECPFCGRYPEVSVDTYDLDRKAQAHIHCGRCFVNVYVSEIREIGYYDTSYPYKWVVTRTVEEAQREALYDAARHWNKRAE